MLKEGERTGQGFLPFRGRVSCDGSHLGQKEVGVFDGTRCSKYVL